MKLAPFLMLSSTLVALDATAMCRYVPPKFAEIAVESCAPIKDEPGLLVSGRVVAYIDLDFRVRQYVSITRIENWDSEPVERFVWTQSSEVRRDCQFVESKQPLLVYLTRPCCDVIT